MILTVVAIVIIIFGFVAFTGAPYVPSRRRDIRRAFDELYPLGANDILVDIGSGDGVVLREASARGAHAVGYEIHPILVAISRFLSRRDQNVTVELVNFWHANLPKNTTVVYLFGDGRDIEKMADYIQKQVNRMNHDVYLMSYGFTTSKFQCVKTVGAHNLYKIIPSK